MTHRDHGDLPAGEPESPAMAHARRVADAVLNGGRPLCPDRASAAEDRLRRHSGVLVPPGYTATAEPSYSVIECLLEAEPEARLHLWLRFLHLRTRTIERAEGGSFHPVPELTVDGRTYRSFQEATERETDVALCLSDLLCEGDVAVPAGMPAGRYGGGPHADARVDDGGSGAVRRRPWPAGAAGERTIMVGVPGDRTVEPIEDAYGRIVGRSVSEHLSLRAAIRVRAVRPCGSYGLTKLRVTVANTHCWADAVAPREHALRRSLVATHLLIGVSGGAFLSPADPPEWAEEAAARCRCQHCRPVLVGPAGSREVLLSAPISLYDHPAIATDRPGELIDRPDTGEPFAPDSRTGSRRERGRGQDRSGHGQDHSGHGQERSGHGQDHSGHGQERVGHGQERVGHGQERGGRGRVGSGTGPDHVRGGHGGTTGVPPSQAGRGGTGSRRDRSGTGGNRTGAEMDPAETGQGSGRSGQESADIGPGRPGGARDDAETGRGGAGTGRGGGMPGRGGAGTGRFRAGTWRIRARAGAGAEARDDRTEPRRPRGDRRAGTDEGADEK